MLLDKINKPNDIKNIPVSQYKRLASEIRKFIIEKVSHTGGHLASNLGVVELTMAMHNVFNFPEDKIIWDVGHQSYVHKILTGRKDDFDTLRQFNGMSGFPKRHESDCDVFDTGHSSTSVSVGLGMAYARDINGENYNVISVIGDGALTGGMAFEAINNMADYNGKFIVVLNDNKMSISKNKGGVPTILNSIRVNKSYNDLKDGVVTGLSKFPNGEKIVGQLRKTKNEIKHLVIPTSIFDDLGIKYLGPLDGHDMDKLIKAFNIAKNSKRPIILHIVTKKGKGYKYAENNPEHYHGVSPFDIKTGQPVSKSSISYTKAFSNKLCEIAAKDEKIAAITASMPEGTGLNQFEEMFPNRYFDVGIAEGHAVTFAAGLANGGLKPVVAIYSSFLQRAYDQILHDVCLQNLPVVFAIDRAGIVGADGETHQGIYDLSYLSIIPNMTLMAPMNKRELEDMLQLAFDINKPAALRYPRGEASEQFDDVTAPVLYGRSLTITSGSEVALISVGNMIDVAGEVIERLKKAGIDATLINARFISPIDENMIIDTAAKHKLIVTLEENIFTGGYGEAVMGIIVKNNLSCEVLPVSLPDKYIEHGTVSELRKKYGLSSDVVYENIISKIR